MKISVQNENVDYSVNIGKHASLPELLEAIRAMVVAHGFSYVEHIQAVKSNGDVTSSEDWQT